MEDYLDLFDLAAHNIQEGLIGNSSGDPSKLQLIAGEHMLKCVCVCMSGCVSGCVCAGYCEQALCNG